MTEDDTFRKLKQVPFSVVWDATDILWDEVKHDEDEYYRRRPAVLSEHGWTTEGWENHFRSLHR